MITEKHKASGIGVRIGRGITKGALEQLKDYIFSPSGIILIVGIIVIFHVFKKAK